MRYLVPYFLLLAFLLPTESCSPPDQKTRNAEKGYFERGLAHAKNGEFDQAIKDFTEAIRVDPRDASAYNNRGNCHAGRGDYVEAIADYTHAIELDPQYANAYYNRGDHYGKRGEHEKAIRDLTEAIRLDAKMASAYSDRGASYSSQNESAKALADFTEAIRLDPDYAPAYYNRGLLHGQKGEYDQSIADFTNALRLRPKDAGIFADRGVSYAKQGDYRKAIADFSEAIRLEPQETGYYQHRAKAYRLLHDEQKALDDERKAQELSKHDQETSEDQKRKLSELENFVNHYHESPAPARVPEMFKILVQEKLIENPSLQRQPERGGEITAESFGHMARGRPDLVRFYESHFADASQSGRLFILQALRVCGDKLSEVQLAGWEKNQAYAKVANDVHATRQFLADPKRKLHRERPAMNPTDLDLLWADFLVTGEYAPVARILDTLDQPNHLRKKIEAWLATNRDRKNELFELLKELGAVQPESSDKLLLGDLDLELMTTKQGGLKQPSPSAMRRFNRLLGLTVEDYIKIAVKGAANWAAQSNLQQYPSLRKLLKEHQKERPEKSRALVGEWLER